MRVAFFSTKSYDKESFNHYLPDHSHEFTYFEPKLDSNTIALAEGYDAICSFVNDHLDEKTLIKLDELGVKNIVLRCAGYNQCSSACVECQRIVQKLWPSMHLHY